MVEFKAGLRTRGTARNALAPAIIEQIDFVTVLERFAEDCGDEEHSPGESPDRRTEVQADRDLVHRRGDCAVLGDGTPIRMLPSCRIVVSFRC